MEVELLGVGAHGPQYLNEQDATDSMTEAIAFILFVSASLPIWLLMILYWFGTAKTDSKSPLKHELVPLFKLAASPLLIYLPLVTGGWFAGRLYPFGYLTGVPGLVVCALGAGIAIWARRALGANWSGRVRTPREHQVVETGPYRTIRHPIYLGVLLAMMGSCLILGYVFSFAYFALSVFGLLRKSRQEEELLAEQFPEQYGAYKQRTRMLIPYVF